MPTTIVTTSVRQARATEIPRNNGTLNSITIDSDTFTDALDFIFEKRNQPRLGFQIKNVGATNGLSYEIYGSIDPNATAPPFATKDWELVTNGSGNITALDNTIFDSQFPYIRLLLRIKRQTSGQNTTAEIVVTSCRL